MNASHRRPLAFSYDRSVLVWVVPFLIILALTLNIAALKLPFLEIRIWPDSAENYSIPHTVHLMWSKFKLYLIAVLVAGFSLIFPFIKLLMLGCAWYLPLHEKTRSRVLSVLGSLGRWSLLDVFVALVLIVLAHGQGSLFVTGVKPGLGFFLTAIFTAMLTGDLMHRLHDRVSTQPDEPPSNGTVSPLLVWMVPVLAVGSFIALVAALRAPYLEITAWFLDKSQYSIVGTILALMQEGDLVFGFAVTVFLVVMPILRICFIGAGWWWRRSPSRLRRISAALTMTERWSMIDVFGLAIGLFLLEGANLVSIEHREGVWLLLVSVIASVTLSKVAAILIRRSAVAPEGAPVP